MDAKKMTAEEVGTLVDAAVATLEDGIDGLRVKWNLSDFAAALLAALPSDVAQAPRVAAADLDELRRATCAIKIVGQIDGHDVIRRGSALDIIEQRERRAAPVAPAAAAPSSFPSLAEFDPEHPLLAKAALPDERTTFLQWVNERPYTPSQMSVEWMWDAWEARATARHATAPWATDAARDVLTERARQVSEEGWTPTHDDQHEFGDLASAAACYALNMVGVEETYVAEYWPWAREWWKPSDARRNLVKSAALLVAEIERLDRTGGEAC